MTGKKITRLSDKDRETFAGIADLLIPRYGRMPSATEIGIHKDIIDQVLGFRPDIGEKFRRGLEKCRGKDPSEAANRLSREDADAFDAISLATSAGYYMNETVRELIGYPGQDQSEYDPFATPEYLTNGMIERVVRRGPMYKPTPRD